MAELADALASGASARKGVGVQVPPRAPPGWFPVSASYLLNLSRDRGTPFAFLRGDFRLLDAAAGSSVPRRPIPKDGAKDKTVGNVGGAIQVEGELYRPKAPTILIEAHLDTSQTPTAGVARFGRPA